MSEWVSMSLGGTWLPMWLGWSTITRGKLFPVNYRFCSAGSEEGPEAGVGRGRRGDARGDSMRILGNSFREMEAAWRWTVYTLYHIIMSSYSSLLPVCMQPLTPMDVSAREKSGGHRNLAQEHSPELSPEHSAGLVRDLSGQVNAADTIVSLPVSGYSTPLALSAGNLSQIGLDLFGRLI